jgi:hypothetical protein
LKGGGSEIGFRMSVEAIRLEEDVMDVDVDEREDNENLN